jgi:lipoprotein-anchoring transpeptidase ErfK/SrfK
MDAVVRRARGRTLSISAVAVVALGLVLSGCAKTTTSAFGTEPSPQVSSVAPTPSTTPSAAPTAPAPPVDPFDTLSAETKKEFKGCLTKVIGPGSSGKCAALVIKKLKAAGFYPWAKTSSINVTGANAILNYQRSRGIKGTAFTNKATWVALATKAPAVPETLPSKCTTTKGIILCVDQAHRKLFWIKNGTVVKTFKVRVGGWAYLKKKDAKQGKWKVYATADGTWKVYDKQVDPFSENYGYGAMPYSTMFYPDMYVHYSPGFHAVGYRQSSHGCVNIGQLSEAKWIFKNTPIGTPVYIYSLKAPKVTTPPTSSPTPGAPSSGIPAPSPTPTS